MGACTGVAAEDMKKHTDLRLFWRHLSVFVMEGECSRGGWVERMASGFLHEQLPGSKMEREW